MNAYEIFAFVILPLSILAIVAALVFGAEWWQKRHGKMTS